MRYAHRNALEALLELQLGPERLAGLLGLLELPADLPTADPEAGVLRVSRAEMAEALSVALFEELLQENAVARAYAEEAASAGRPLRIDHGGLRTVAADCGDLPPGREAFERFLEPLGYRVSGVYPLGRLGMTGYAYTHLDRPETVPQFFVSELHPERFSERFQASVAHVVGASRDPLRDDAVGRLVVLEERGSLPLPEAARLLSALLVCFGRQHEPARLADYRQLLAESAEMAWITTEGNACHHTSDRVADVEALAEEQRRQGRPIADHLEVSRTGHLLQTAFRAPTVERAFRGSDGRMVRRRVPGSYHELITRKPVDGRLDLTFDVGRSGRRRAQATSQPGL